MAKATHDQFRIGGGIVSLWLGNFESEDDMDAYFRAGFEENFGFEIYPPAGPEADVQDEAVDIRTLLEGFSQAESFVDAAVVAANGKGWMQATTAVVFYNFRYDAAFINPNDVAPINFIGVFDCGGFE